jgi:hypothetical protein
MRLPGKVRAALARTHYVLCVAPGHGPVEALSEGLSDEGPGRSMVAIDPLVYVKEESPTFDGHHASLQDARGTPVMQLPLVHYKRLSPSSEVACLCLVFGQPSMKLGR